MFYKTVVRPNKTHWCGRIATEIRLSCLIMSLWLCFIRKGKWETRAMHSTTTTLCREQGSSKEMKDELLKRYGLRFRGCGQNLFLYKRPPFKSRLWAVHIDALDEFLTLLCRLVVVLRSELGTISIFINAFVFFKLRTALHYLTLLTLLG